MTPTFDSPRFYYTFGPHPPAATVRPGRSLRIVCPDSDNHLADGSLLPPDRRQNLPGPCPPVAGNPMAGPIAVEGCSAGDTVAVRINAIHLTGPRGRTLLAPHHGAIAADVLGADVPRRMLEWAIDAPAGVARLTNPFGDQPIALPLRPFIGCIGVQPAGAQSVSTLFAGEYGGNMDLPILGPGTTLLLPAFADGGMVSLGDLHAAQGDGEVIGGGVEVPGEADCTFSIVAARDDGVGFARAFDADRLYAIAAEGTLRRSVEVAYARLIAWLAGGLKLDRFDAHAIVSHCGAITIGNLNCAPFAVAAGVPRDALPARSRQVAEALP